MAEEFEANCCRVCLTKSKKLRSLYKPIDEGDEPPNEMLKQITGIQVEEINEHIMLPKSICKNCELSLSMAFEFRANALKTQEIIVSYLKELNIPEISKTNSMTTIQSKGDNRELKMEEPIKTKKEDGELKMEEPIQSKKEDEELEIENTIDVDDLDDQLTDDKLQISNSDILDNKNILENEDEYSAEEVDSNSYGEPNDNQEFNEETQEYVLGENDSYNEDNENYAEQQWEGTEDDEERIDECEEEEVIKLEEEQIEQQEMVQEIEPQPQKLRKLENTNVLGKSIKKRATKSWKKLSNTILIVNEQQEEEIEMQHLNDFQQIQNKREKSTLADNNGHICDVCGNVFNKRSRMMEHRQRHDKELKYACELCDKKFHMRELLRKHMFSHSGGKPLKCGFCSRTFYYESVRRAHEAVHQGLKPYVCDVCGKAFGYAHALKKHKLIHAEIKLYRCEYCNKDFRLQHHMKQHELTRMHQNAVLHAGIIPASSSYDRNHGSQDPDDAMQDEQDMSGDILLIEEITDEQFGNAS